MQTVFMGAMLTSLVLLSGTVIGGCITKNFNDVYIHVLCEYTLISHANNNVMCHDQKNNEKGYQNKNSIAICLLVC